MCTCAQTVYTSFKAFNLVAFLDSSHAQGILRTMDDKINKLRTDIVKHVKDTEQERHRLYFPPSKQTAEKIAKYTYVTKYQQLFLKLLSDIDDKDYVTAHASGNLSKVLPEIEQ